MTLGNAAAARVRLVIWCKECQHQVEPDPGEMAARYGAETPVLDWRERLVCSRCGSWQVDMVVSGTARACRACDKTATLTAGRARLRVSSP
jgi:Zn finger protein HypA/HybF involved in hydrogenase expression